MRRANRGPTGASAARADGESPASTIEAGALVLDLGRHEARIGERRLDLTPIEYRLAEALVRAGGDLVPHLRLVRAGWPAEADPDLLWLKPHVARLRRKVESAGGPAIIALRGVGYRLEINGR
jgi:DNA-binding response OmpR family regulator